MCEGVTWGAYVSVLENRLTENDNFFVGALRSISVQLHRVTVYGAYGVIIVTRILADVAQCAI